MKTKIKIKTEIKTKIKIKTEIKTKIKTGIKIINKNLINCLENPTEYIR